MSNPLRRRAPLTPNLENKTRLAPIEVARLAFASCAWAGRSAPRWTRGEGAYHEAVAELRGAVRACPPSDELAGAAKDTTESWSRHRREIRRRLLSCDPAGFLAWTPIVRSMTFGLLPWVRTEFQALRHSGQWESRWRRALEENRAGLPMPSHIHPRTSGTLIHHAYHLHRFEAAAGRSIADSAEIVEFGGGYGSMARLVTRLGYRGRYHIYDLPEFSALQKFYLRLVRAEVGDNELAEALSRVTSSERLESASPSNEEGAVFLATWSLSETPIERREVWRSALDRFGHFLIGFQDRFEDIDNRTWFEDFAAGRRDVTWRFEPATHRGPGVQYLFGVPRREVGHGEVDSGARPT